MTEYDIYVPSTLNDGAAVDEAMMAAFKQRLTQAFGGYTHLRQGSEGAWSMGGVTFRDEVTIIRVLDDGQAHFDMKAFKKELEAALHQQSILIVQRRVEVVS